MKIKQSSKSSLFLIELIIAIFFFIIAATICIQLFVKSYTISNETISINHAVLWTQNLAEIFSNQDGNYQLIKDIYEKEDCIALTSLKPETHLLLLFDTNWCQTNDIDTATYYVLSAHSQENFYLYQDIFIMKYDGNISAITDDPKLINEESLIFHQQLKQFVFPNP